MASAIMVQKTYDCILKKIENKLGKHYSVQFQKSVNNHMLELHPVTHYLNHYLQPYELMKCVQFAIRETCKDQEMLNLCPEFLDDMLSIMCDDSLHLDPKITPTSTKLTMSDQPKPSDKIREDNPSTSAKIKYIPKVLQLDPTDEELHAIYESVKIKGLFYNMERKHYPCVGKCDFCITLAKAVEVTRCCDVKINHKPGVCHSSGMWPHLPRAFMQGAVIANLHKQKLPYQATSNITPRFISEHFKSRAYNDIPDTVTGAEYVERLNQQINSTPDQWARLVEQDELQVTHVDKSKKKRKLSAEANMDVQSSPSYCAVSPNPDPSFDPAFVAEYRHTE